jgi:hypothetical protein
VKKQTSIRWKRVEAFQEESKEGTRFGFTLIRGSNHQDFYVDSSEALDDWISQFASTAVMTDLEDLSLDKEIGKGNYAVVYAGRQAGHDSVVAIKVIEKTIISESARTVLALVNEVDLMKKLDHPTLLNCCPFMKMRRSCIWSWSTLQVATCSIDWFTKGCSWKRKRGSLCGSFLRRWIRCTKMESFTEI